MEGSLSDSLGGNIVLQRPFLASFGYDLVTCSSHTFVVAKKKIYRLS
jgi:hypothetical protein